MRVLKRLALRARFRALGARLLLAFTDWFASAACVWETTIIVGAIAVFELADPTLDQHGFWLLWALTIYSGVTQPALAHSGQRQSDKLDGVLARMEGLEVSIYEMDQRIYDAEQRILAALQNASGAGQAEEIEQVGRTTSDDRGSW